ncbi:MAG: transketolase [Phycisphaeraceae bacterium]|nr:transketolase [Phycisphaeraceae bacterium]MBX3366390.1 transketolase [Phycisphaeraceae bacterium]QYK47732.1 MAG: transketolase [Phycisphaeraceae bacterium]
MSFEAAVHAQAIELGKISLEMTAAAGSGHPTTALSLAHITTVLMFHTMRWSPEYPDYPTSDRLVLSEGHAVPIVYAAACELGVMVGKDPENRRALTREDAKTLRAWNSELDGHPNPMEGFPFFDAATGSLGQGLSVAAGVGEAARLDKIGRHVYCIIGDGEAREGQITEALDYIIDRKLNNVLPIFNCNGYGQADRVSQQQSADRLAAKLEASGYVVKVIDGHSPSQIKGAFDAFVANAADPSAAPMAIVAKTVKGWGSQTVQGGGWHGKPATGDALRRALADLDERRVELTSTLVATDAFEIQPPEEAPDTDPKQGDLPPMGEAMKSMDMESLLHTGKLATRRAYGIALRALGNVNDRVVVLDCDVSNSTFAEAFGKVNALAERFMECKIGEQNMFSVAAGLSAAGKIPFCSTFAKFVTRGYDQIEMAINSGANIKIVGSHAGITLASDGPSQMALPDVAWFRSFSTMRDHRGNPGCYVLQPADAFAAYALTGVMAEYEGACYMRTLRADTEFLYSDKQVFNLGGFEVLQEGRDVVLCASGYMVHEANKAIELLDKAGISATLVDLYSLPFDSDKLLDIVNENGGYVISLEDNYGGGIGSAIADILAESGDGFTLHQMYVKRIPKSAKTPDEMLQMCGLTAQDILKATLKLLQVA